MNNIIEIGKARFERRLNKHCPHRHLLYDTRDESIECADCGRPISAFKALMILISYLERAHLELDAKKTELVELEKKNIILKAAKRVEKAWRSRTMVPVCPHCDEPIFPDDGLGGHNVNKKRALERRAFNARGKK